LCFRKNGDVFLEDYIMDQKNQEFKKIKAFVFDDLKCGIIPKS